MNKVLSYEEEIKRGKTKEIVKKVVLYTFLSIWGIIVLFPFYWMLITSFKSYASYNSEVVPNFIPLHATLDNYVTAFTQVRLGKYLFNTLFFSLATTALMIVVSILAAFGFSRIDFKGKDIIFTLFLALMMIPNELVIITNFATITTMNLRNTFSGLILPSVTSVFYIYLLKENFSQISDYVYYAAKVDGSSDFKYLMKIVIPISRPTIVSVLILKIIECWNSFVWPRLITSDSRYFLVSNGIQEIRENGFGRENIPAMMAAVVVISLPLIILFLVFRKQIMSGVSKSGTKR